MTSDQKIVKVSLGEPVGFMIWCENRSSQLEEATYQSFFLTTYYLLITTFQQHNSPVLADYCVVIVIAFTSNNCFFLKITQLDDQLHGAVEVIGKVEHDCSLSSQRIIPYDQEFGECFSSNFFFA